MEHKNTFHTLDDLYISPFNAVRFYDNNGTPHYMYYDRNLHPTGIYAADHLLQSLTNGETTIKAVARRLGCSGRDISGLIRCLTGMPSDDFRTQYLMRLVDDLLCYTSLSLADVARRSGIGSERNLYSFCRRRFRCTPAERRNKIRSLGDVGRYALPDDV